MCFSFPISSLTPTDIIRPPRRRALRDCHTPWES
jgi:hypothetical protein